MGESKRKPSRTERALRRGWTTGACATAAAKAAFIALATGEFPDPVEIELPKGQSPAFVLDQVRLVDGGAEAAVIKDAGDDPDVTHGALVRVHVIRTAPGSGIAFAAGPGVGTVTKTGLPLAVGEPAINPAPRAMIEANIRAAAEALGTAPDCRVTIGIDGGAGLAKRTWNPRLGIEGGLSVLGTTGIVVPYSCSAWIASIHQGIDVARAGGLTHVAACTGSTSEAAVKTLHGLADSAIIDMGDFVGGTVKYLRRKPIPRLTVAGGFAKLSKLAAGHMDLHSKRSEVDPLFLAELARGAGADETVAARISRTESAGEALKIAGETGLDLGAAVAEAAAAQVRAQVGPRIDVEVLVCDRSGRIVGCAPFESGRVPA